MSITKAQLIEENERLRAALTEALDQQTATGEILQVISGSPTMLQPVLDAIANNAARTCPKKLDRFEVEDCASCGLV